MPTLQMSMLLRFMLGYVSLSRCTAAPLTGLVSSTPLRPFRDCVEPINPSTYVSNTNSIFDKFNIALVSGTDTTISLQSALNLFQRVGDDCSNSIYITVDPTTIPAATTLINIVFTPRPDAYSPNTIPTVYSIFSNDTTGIVALPTTPVTLLNTFTLQVTVTSSLGGLILLVTENGIINRARYSYDSATTTLTTEFFSDIFTTNPIVFVDPTFVGVVPTAYTLPTNEMITLRGVFNLLKASATIKCVSEEQLRRIEVAAAIDEIRSLFCRKNRCCKPVCETAIYVDYVTFVSSCIQVIAHCNETKVCPKALVCDVVAENRCEWMNRRIVDCCRGLQTVSAKVSVDVSAMFGDVFPCDTYAPSTGVSVCADTCVEVVEGVPCDSLNVIEGIPCEDVSSSEDEEIEKRRRRPAKRTVAVKSKTSVTTYGWYAAGGVVVVSIAVAVYVFVL